MQGFRYEYRINKKGAECFRSKSCEEAREKFRELDAKRSGIYTMQWRSCRCNKVGVLDQDWLGRPQWSPWRGGLA